MRSFKLIVFALFSMFLNSFAQPAWNCGEVLVDSRDGKSYKTVQIGTQCWMKENLNYGNMIQNITGQGGQMMHDNGVIEKYCYDNIIDKCDGTNGQKKLGAFYEFQEAMQYYAGQPNLPARGVCPEGWHIPSTQEWSDLMYAIGGSMQEVYTKMMVGGSSGFDAILTGYRCTASGNFKIGALGTPATYFWYSKEVDAANANFLVLDQGDPKVQVWPYYKSLGISVRCLQDQGSNLNENDQIDDLNIGMLKKESINNYSFEFSSLKNRNINLEIFDTQGKLVFEKKINTVTGNNSIKFTVNEELLGIYLVSLTDGSVSVNKKLILF